VIVTPDQLPKIIELAMKAKAPRMYRELQASGDLAREIEERVSLALEIQDQVENEPLSHLLSHPKKDPMEQQAAARQIISRAWEQAIAVATEFPEEENEPDEMA
jgi:hypothetical protein